MAKAFVSGFSRRGPDLITEELAAILTQKSSYEFKPLFELVHENLRGRNYSGGGEEMMRLKAYEKLQNLVERGMVKKTINKTVKTYSGLATLVSALPVVLTSAPAEKES